MKIESADFVKSAFDKSHWVADVRPEIAFLGRSNVGKSSLINSLLLRKGLARTSNTPGRTQSINFFRVVRGQGASSGRSSKAIDGDADLKTDNRPLATAFYFADLPGYGFARVSKTMRADWGHMAEEYLSERQQLALCIQLIDSRHAPTALDIQLNEWLVFHEKPHLVVATKADKISKNDLRKSLAAAGKMFEHSKILTYSARTGLGRDEVWAEIIRAVKIM